MIKLPFTVVSQRRLGREFRSSFSALNPALRYAKRRVRWVGRLGVCRIYHHGAAVAWLRGKRPD